MLTFSRQYQFSATHRLWQAKWSAQQNEAAFGLSSESHGHDYKFVVTLQGNHNPLWGGVYDLVALDALIQTRILDKVTEQHLDQDVDFLKNHVITVETLSQAFFQEIAPYLHDERFPETRLYSVKVAESDDLWAETTQ